MVIVYTTTNYVSRYFPALDSVLTFPVISEYAPSTAYRPFTQGYMDSCNMTNDSTVTSSGSVIIQRRPSVIKEVPRQSESVVIHGEEEFDTIDVVGLDEVADAEDGLKTEESGIKSGENKMITEVDGLKTEINGTKVEEEKETSKGNEGSVLNGSRRGKRKRVELIKGNQSNEDSDWRLLENKRHVCNECGMRFKKPSALVIHLRTHTGERPYACELCDKRFSISGNLRRHMFTHTGEKPYKCRACGRAFNNPSHLARHSKKIHI